MASALGLLGVIPFVCSSSVVMTFKDLQVERSDRWATHEVIGQKPKLEYIGPQLLPSQFFNSAELGTRCYAPGGVGRSAGDDGAA